MIYGIGTDAVSFSRIEAGIKSVGEPYLSRVFTPAEREQAQCRADSRAFLASRFAVKEAAFKALHLSEDTRFDMLDVETLSTESGEPVLMLRGTLLAKLTALGRPHFHVSISYENNMAFAAVLIELDSETDEGQTH